MTTKNKTQLDEAEAFEISYHHLQTLLLQKQQNEELAALGLPSLEEMYQKCRKARAGVGIKTKTKA